MKNLKVLQFHTGRGGRFYNSGYLQFIDFKTIQDSNVFENHFEMEDGTWKKSSGNDLDCKIHDNGTGYVNSDEDYDTDTFVLESELTDKHLDALKSANHWNTNEVERLLTNYGYDE